MCVSLDGALIVIRWLRFLYVWTRTTSRGFSELLSFVLFSSVILLTFPWGLSSAFVNECHSWWSFFLETEIWSVLIGFIYTEPSFLFQIMWQLFNCDLRCCLHICSVSDHWLCYCWLLKNWLKRLNRTFGMPVDVAEFWVVPQQIVMVGQNSVPTKPNFHHTALRSSPYLL